MPSKRFFASWGPESLKRMAAGKVLVPEKSQRTCERNSAVLLER